MPSVWTFLIPLRRRGGKARKKILDLEAEVAKRDRRIAVLQAEIDSLSAVVARDRLRVQSETAEYARKKAEAEDGHTPSRV